MGKKCSFCGYKKDDFLPGIQRGIGICKSCSPIAYEHFYGKLENNRNTNTNKKEASPLYSNLLKPHELKKRLDEYVIGQENAKKILTVEIYNHYKRINSKIKSTIPKNNVLLIGDSGSGKTYLIETMAKLINVPLSIIDATSLTEAGYIGKDVDSILITLLQEANGDVSSAEKGIVFIDEVDKLAKRLSNSSTRDPQGEGVQQALLKMIEGSNFTIDINQKLIKKTTVTMNTSNILFVFAGAFGGLDEIVKNRTVSKTIGFTEMNQLEENYESPIKTEDLIEFGMVPEFIGRIPLILKLNALTKENMIDILVKPKGAIIPEYQKLFQEEHKKLDFTSEAIEYIAIEAIHKGLGARGVTSIIAKKMNELLYEMLMDEELTEFTVTKEFFIS
ncbi:ATP-dependent Clp protease ATP-binding subunit ClpX [Bacillus sp. NPDC094106]|uniref:ATP-dependent Clp protease ATP-binding subunit ClpX n=1 Tax=Bacillus sp. NPDC094106 TaxID=3363949 RepID=UPI00380BB426